MSGQAIDLATIALDYEGFRKLATDTRLTAHEKIGFPPAYREGFEDAILADILTKLPKTPRRPRAARGGHRPGLRGPSSAADRPLS